MKISEMKRRLKAGEDPLDLSIQKWQDIVDGKGEDLLNKNCALCHKYRPKPDDMECDGCPVKQKTESNFCRNTPYPEFSVAVHRKLTYDKESVKNYAQKELDFLKSLKKEGQK